MKEYGIISVLFLCAFLRLTANVGAQERDPFTSQLPAKSKVEIVRQTKEVPRPALVIQGLVWQTSMPEAIINSCVVKVGDMISQEIKVIDISKEGIMVEYQGYSFFYPSALLTPLQGDKIEGPER